MQGRQSVAGSSCRGAEPHVGGLPFLKQSNCPGTYQVLVPVTFDALVLPLVNLLGIPLRNKNRRQ